MRSRFLGSIAVVLLALSAPSGAQESRAAESGPAALPTPDLRALTIQLEGPDDHARRNAAWEVGKLGPKAGAALPALLAALAADFPPKAKSKDAEAELIASSWGEKPSDLFRKPRAGGWSPAEETFLEYRNAYLWAIARMGREGNRASKTLSEIVSAGHVALRPDAVRALAAVDPGNPETLKLATSLLDHPNPFMRLAAEDAVHLLGPRAASARKTLLKRLPDLRPYEVRATFRALETVGWEGPAETADLVAASKKKPDVAIAALLRLGLVEQADAATIAALQEGLKSKHPVQVCASALSLGRLVPSPGMAAADLLTVVRRVQCDEEMDVWDATKIAFAVEALGRLGMASSESLTRLTRVAREIHQQSWAVIRLAGLDEEAVARAFWMIRAPSDALMTTLAPGSPRSDPPWWADEDLDAPDPGVVLWAHQASPTHVQIEFGRLPEGHADWSTLSKPRSEGDVRRSVLLSARREEEGIDLRLVPADRAIRWALQREPESRPPAYRLEGRVKAADFDAAERLDLDFRTHDPSVKDYEGFRWSGGFSLPNPFRRAPR